MALSPFPFFVFPPQAWNGYFEQHGLLSSSQEEIYVACLYWAIVTLATIGYGDITPSTQNERVMTICVML